MLPTISSQLIITAVIVTAAVALFLSDRLRPDLIALLSLVALGVSGVLTPQEAFSGFSRSAVITILSIFIMTEGLQQTGVTEQVGDLLLRMAGSSEKRLIVVVMLAGACLSLFMNNIAAASVLLPAVSSVAHRTKVSSARLLMPLAFATILGGMATLLTTTNVVVSGLLRDQKLSGYGLLDFAPVGLPIVVIGITYMALWGRRLLPVESPADQLLVQQQNKGDLAEVYRLGERLFRAQIPAKSSLIDRPLAQSALREKYGLTVLAIERDDYTLLSPPPDATFQERDVVLFQGNLEDFRRRDIEPYLEILPPRDWREQDLESPTVVVTEVVLSPRSRLIGQTLRDAHFREKFGMMVLGIWREGRQRRTGLTDLRLQFGDALLLQGSRERLVVLRDEPDLIVLGNHTDKIPMSLGKGRLALGIAITALALGAINSVTVGEMMLGGALAMVLVGVLTMDQAYRAVEWKTVALVAGMLPMGIAITKTGAATLLANGLVAFLGPAGPLAMLAGLFIFAMLLTQAMNGAAVAVVVAPIAIQTGHQLGADPRALVMGVALATSTAFLTPLGHPVNVLVMSPGGYSFRDYLKVGLPLTLLVFAAVMLLLPVFWRLTSG
ncbi:MAG: SLC13 family permease [Chloroflexi bacterium]|nr:SLC13 family permease [Chloroflexota bacterium]